MKLALIACLVMLGAAIVLALSAARTGWFPPLAFCGTIPFLIAASVLGAMALCAVACVLMRRGACRRGGAFCAVRPRSTS